MWCCLTSAESLPKCRLTRPVLNFPPCASISPQRIRKRLRHPLAATDAFQGNQDRDWKKGFLWFAKGDSIDPALHVPIWPSPPKVRRIINGVTEMEDPNANFKAVLLHEMGHVFGNNHVYSTIMSSRLYSELIGSMNNQGGAISPGTLRIDNGLDLLLPNGYYTPNPNALKNAYQLLTGCTTHSEVTAVAHRARSSSYKPGRRADDQNSGSITVEFKDGTEVSQVQIEVLNKISRKDESSPLFNGNMEITTALLALPSLDLPKHWTENRCR